MKGSKRGGEEGGGKIRVKRRGVGGLGGQRGAGEFKGEVYFGGEENLIFSLLQGLSGKGPLLVAYYY